MENNFTKNRTGKIAGLVQKLQHFSLFTRNILKNIFTNNYICIIGMDGTGKSSAVNELKEILGENVVIQYMGSKDYITRFAQNRLSDEKKNKNMLSRIVYLTAGLVEMWYRVIRHWPDNKIVIFDRYSWERYLFLHGADKVLGRILYRTLFPKPRYIFYLYCPAELSFSRKNDIADKKEFIRNKQCFDEAFLSDKSVTAIDTAMNDLSATVFSITNVCCRKDSNLTGK